MKISTRGRYGLRALADLAAHQGDGYETLKRIAARQNVSLNYLEHSFSALKKAGIVCGLPGSRGGYRLMLPPDRITVEQVLRVLEGDLSIVAPTREATPTGRHVKRAVWDRVDARVREVLSGVTIADLL